MATKSQELLKKIGYYGDEAEETVFQGPSTKSTRLLQKIGYQPPQNPVAPPAPQPAAPVAPEISIEERQRIAQEKAAAAELEAKRAQAAADVQQAEQIPGLYTNALGAGGGQRLNQAKAVLEPTREERLAELQKATKAADFGETENRDNLVEEIFSQGKSGIQAYRPLDAAGEMWDIRNETRDRSILNMTEEERAIYAYYAATDPESADAYLNAIMPELETRYAQEMAQQGKGNIGSALVTGIASGAASGVEGIGKWFSGNPEEQSIFEKTQQAYQQANQGTAAGVVGDLSYSVGNMLPSIFAAGMTGGASVASGLTMGMGSGGNAYAQAKREGYDDGQAMLYGALIGTSEALLQYALGGISKLGRGGIGKLPGMQKVVSALDGAIARVIKNPQAMNAIRKVGGFLGSMNSEGTEEYLQSVLEPIFRNAVFGEENEINLLSEDKLYSYLLGALMGGVFEGANAMTGATAYDAQIAARQAEARAALEVDVQSLGLDQRTSERVIQAYDSISEGQTGKAQRSINKLHGAVTHALEVRAEAEADVNVARVQAQARLSPLYTAMEQAAMNGNVAAFQEAQARYMAEFSVQQAKAEAAKVKAANQVEAANRAIRDTTAEIEEDTAVAHAREQLSGAGQGNGSPGGNIVTGPFEAGIMNAGGGADGGQQNNLEGIQAGVPAGAMRAGTRGDAVVPGGTAGAGAYSPDAGSPGRVGRDEAGYRGLQEGPRERVSWGFTATSEAEETLRRHAETVFEATGQRPEIRIVNEVDRETAALLDEVRAFTNVDAFLYESDDDFAYGMATPEGAFIRDTGNPLDMVRQYAHEAAHLTPQVMKLGLKAVERIGQNQVDAYAAFRNSNISTPDDADVRRELVADAFGGYIQEVVMGIPANPMGLSPDAIVTLYNAFEDAMGATETETGEVVDEIGNFLHSDTEYSRVGSREIIAADGTIIDQSDFGNPEKENSGFPFSVEGMSEQDQAKVLFEFAKYEVTAGDNKDRIRLGEVSDRFVEDVLEASGGQVDVRGLTHYVFADGIRHGWKHNAQEGKASVTAEDIAAVPYIINDYDRIVVTPKRGETSVKLYKKINGTVVYVEIVGKKRGHLFTKNVWRETTEEPSRRMDSNAPHQTAEPAAFFGSSNHSIFDPEGEVNYSRMTFPDPDGTEYMDEARKGQVIQHSYTMPEIRERTDKAIEEHGGGKYRADFTMDGQRIRLEGDDRAALENQIQQMKQEYAMGHLSQSVKNLREARRLFKEGYTPAAYYESGQYDHAVGRLLRRMCIDAGQETGGALAADHLKSVTRNMNNWKNMHAAANTLTSPQRLFQSLGNWRDRRTPSARAENYLEGKQLEDTYWYYVMRQGADANLWMQEQREKIGAVYREGDVRTSTLAQMLGEGLITEKAARAALYDGKAMVVRDDHGTFVFDRRGQLVAVQSGDQLLMFDESYYKRVREANKAIREMAYGKDKKLTDAERQEKIKALERQAREAKPKAAEGTLTIVEGGNSIKVMHGNTVIADIRNGQRPDMNRVTDLRDSLRAFYDETFELQNRTLVENGHRPIDKRKNYFPHMGRTTTGVQDFLDTVRGMPDSIPVEIAGLTGTFKPGKPFTSHLLERMGMYTEFDAIRGFNTYVQAAADLIYYTPAIQRLRQLESAIRENSTGSQNSDLVSWLSNYTNQVANKKSGFDRSFEEIGGRAVYSVTDRLTRWFGAASVAGSLSSTLSNAIGLLSAIPSLDNRYLGRGLQEAMLNNIHAISGQETDGFADQFAFLARRYRGYESILTTELAKAKRAGSKALGVAFTAADRLAVETAARTKYHELMAKGYEHAEAVKETDKFLNQVFAERSKGMAPALFNIKSLKPFSQFQLEAMNQISHLRDINRLGVAEKVDEIIRRNGGNVDGIDWSEPENALQGVEWKAGVRKLIYLLLMALWGELVTRPLMGRDQTWNLIGMGKDFAADAARDGIGTAAGNLASNVAEQLPGGSLVMPLITGEEAGRVPAMGGIDKVRDFITTAIDEEASPEDKAMAGMQAAASFIPGGGQASKTIRGAQAWANDGAYSASGNLRYPIAEENFVQAVLFGPSAVAPEGYDWQRDTLSAKKTEQYEQLREEGFDRFEAYDLLRTMKASDPNGTKAGKLAHIATFDANGDGTPDLTGKEMNIVAEVLGIKMDGSDVKKAAREEVKARIAYIEAEDDLTKEEQEKKIEDENLRFFLTVLGK